MSREDFVLHLSIDNKEAEEYHWVEETFVATALDDGAVNITQVNGDLVINMPLKAIEALSRNADSAA